MTDMVRGYATARLDQLEAKLVNELGHADPDEIEEAHAEIAEIRAMMKVDE